MPGLSFQDSAHPQPILKMEQIVSQQTFLLILFLG
jgi:hypothetical protein